MNPRNGIGRAMSYLVILIVICFLAMQAAPWNGKVVAQGSNSLRQAASDGPAHTGELVNLVMANTTDVLIVTGGYGPLTGISPIQEKDFWSTVLSEMPGLKVDWFDGVPTSGFLSQYDLVIYDAGGYWYPLSNVAQPLRDYHFSGKPLIVVTPDTNYDWQVHGEPVPSFSTDVLHINGILGIVPQSTYQVYANTGHEIIFGIPPEVVMSVPAVTSWPDCFDPQPSCAGVLTNGLIPSTEFGVGTCSGLPSYSQYDPAGHLFAVVAYSGSITEGRAVTYGFPISGLQNSDIAKQLAKNSILFCLSSVPATYNLTVTPSSSTPKVDEVVTFWGVVTDNNGNPVPNIQLGIEDPIAEMSTLASTGADGHFTYSVKANRAGQFRFLFYLEGIPTECLIEVQPLDTSWANQVLYVRNPSSTRYQVRAYVNGSLGGTWTIDPGEQRTLWEAPDHYGSYTLHILTKDLTTAQTTEAFVSPKIQLDNTYDPGVCGIPQNPSLSDYYIQSTYYTSPENALSTAYIIGNGYPLLFQKNYGFETGVGPVKIGAGLGIGPSVNAGGYVEAGCSAFTGLEARCEWSCGAGAGLELGTCIGLCIPIETFYDFGCGFKCQVVVAEVECGVAAGVKAQAGYEASAGAYGTIGISAQSPVLVSVVDPMGRIGGNIPNVSYDTNFIPGATYSGPGTEPQTVSISNSILGEYKVILSGIGEGPYTVIITRLLGQETVFTQTYSGVITTGEVLESKLTLSEANGIVTTEATEPESIAPLPPPTLLSPSNGTITNDNTVDLDWSDVTDPLIPVQYQVQVDDNNDFSSPEYDSGWINVSNVTSLPLADNTYYWRARARYGVGTAGNWSVVWQFTVDTTPPSAVPSVTFWGAVILAVTLAGCAVWVLRRRRVI